MTKTNKIVQYHIQEEANELIDDGLGTVSIAKKLTTNHPDVDGGISHMCVYRYKDIRDRNELEEVVSSGGDPIEELNKEFREAIRKNTKRVVKLVKTADKILKQAMEDGTISDKTRALKEVRDSIGQEVKNWTALQQYGLGQVRFIGTQNIKKEQDIKILLINWTDQLLKAKSRLCDDCKKIVDDILGNLFNS